VGEQCTLLITELFTKFGDSLTYRGNDYQKAIQTQLGIDKEIKYVGNAFIQRCPYI
jgi:hypothetical protein